MGFIDFGTNRQAIVDYVFAKGLTTFQAITAAKTPRPSQKLVIAGLTAMDREMDWFEEHAAKESLDLSAPDACPGLQQQTHSAQSANSNATRASFRLNPSAKPALNSSRR